MEPERIANIRGTVIASVTLHTPQRPAITSLPVCGHLGEFRYFDMDPAIGRSPDVLETEFFATGKSSWRLLIRKSSANAENPGMGLACRRSEMLRRDSRPVRETGMPAPALGLVTNISWQQRGRQRTVGDGGCRGPNRVRGARLAPNGYDQTIIRGVPV